MLCLFFEYDLIEKLVSNDCTQLIVVTLVSRCSRIIKYVLMREEARSTQPVRFDVIVTAARLLVPVSDVKLCMAIVMAPLHLHWLPSPAS